MKKRKIGFLLILLGIILIVGCENNLTGSVRDEDDDSRAAVSQEGITELLYSKEVTVTEVKDVVYIFGSSPHPLDAIKAGNYHYSYQDDEGYSGSLTSYKYDLGSAPRIYNTYIVYPDVKIYYKGTVSN